MYDNYHQSPVSLFVNRYHQSIINLSLSSHRASYYHYYYCAIVARLVVLLCQVIVPALGGHQSFSVIALVIICYLKGGTNINLFRAPELPLI